MGYVIAKDLISRGTFRNLASTLFPCWWGLPRCVSPAYVFPTAQHPQAAKNTCAIVEGGLLFCTLVARTPGPR